MAIVLVVDDEPDILFFLQVILEEIGHRVLVARNGKEGLETAVRSVPDLIVTDWNMPQMDGAEFCARLRLYPTLAHVPVVMLSARYPPVGKEALWNTFLRKPVDLETFESTVGGLLVSRLPSPARTAAPHDPAPSRWQPIFWKCWP